MKHLFCWCFWTLSWMLLDIIRYLTLCHVTFCHINCSLLFLSKSLILIKEPLLAIRSDRSWQKSDSEQIPQVTNQKWVTVSNLLRSLTKNEWPWAIYSGRSPKINNCERILQISHDTKSDLSESLFFLNKSLFHSQNKLFTQTKNCYFFAIF